MSSALPRKLQRDRKHHGRRQLSVTTFSRNIPVDWRAAVVSVVRIWILRVASRTETGGPWSEHSYVPSREKVVVSSSAPCLTLFVKLTLFCPWAGLVVSDWWQCDRLCGVSVCHLADSGGSTELLSLTACGEHAEWVVTNCATITTTLLNWLPRTPTLGEFRTSRQGKMG